MTQLPAANDNPNNVTKLPNGTVIEFTTKKLRVSIVRRVFKDRDGHAHYTRTFYLRRQTGSKRMYFPLGADKAAAERIGEEIYCFLSIPTNTHEMAVAKYDPRYKVVETRYATFGECLEKYEGALSIVGSKGGSVSASTAKGYKTFLIAMLRKVEAYQAGQEFVPLPPSKYNDLTPWLSLSTQMLTKRLVMDFKLSVIPPDEEDLEVILTAKITADTTLRNARSLFAKRALGYYKEMGLTLPDVTPFLEEPLYGAKKYFQLLPPQVITQIFQDSLALRAKDPEAYRAFFLCAMLGMRAGDAAAYTPESLRKEDRPVVYVTTKGKFAPKHGHGRKVYIPDWVEHTLNDLAQGNAFITDDKAFDRLNDWINARVPRNFAVQKPTHELRKLWFSYKVKVDGIMDAAKQGGHKDPKITSDYYADNTMPELLLPWWQMPPAEATKLVPKAS